MIVALLNQKGGVGKTTLALHLAGALGAARKARDAHRRRSARIGARLVRAARQEAVAAPVRRHRPRARHPPPGSAGARPRRRPRRHRRAAARRRLAALGAARGRPRPRPGAAIALRRLGVGRDADADAEARIFRPQLVARFVLNRCPARTIIARETADEPRRSRSAGARVPHRPARRLRRRRAHRPASSSSTTPHVRRARDRRARRRNRKARRHDARARPMAASRRGRATPSPGSARPSRGHGARAPAISTPPGSLSTSRQRCAAASRSRPSSAARPSPTCCATLLAREFPDTDGGKS